MVETTKDWSIYSRSMMGGEVMGVGYSGGIRDGDGHPLLTYLNLLIFFLSSLSRRKGIGKNIFFSPPRSLLFFDGVVEAEEETEGSGGGRRR